MTMMMIQNYILHMHETNLTNKSYIKRALLCPKKKLMAGCFPRLTKQTKRNRQMMDEWEHTITMMMLAAFDAHKSNERIIIIIIDNDKTVLLPISERFKFNWKLKLKPKTKLISENINKLFISKWDDKKYG